MCAEMTRGRVPIRSVSKSLSRITESSALAEAVSAANHEFLRRWSQVSELEISFHVPIGSSVAIQYTAPDGIRDHASAVIVSRLEYHSYVNHTTPPSKPRIISH